MRTHHAIRPAAPGFTGGGDEVRTPCHGYAHVYDELGETSRTPEWAEALEAARNLCGTCLLNSPEIARPCLKRGLEERARWAHAVLGKPLRHVDHPTEGVTAPTATAEGNRQRAAILREQRIADMTRLIDGGATLEEVLTALGISRSSLSTWCYRNGCSDLYARVAPGRGSHNRKAAA